METGMNQHRRKRMSLGCDEVQRKIGAVGDPDPHRRPYVLSSHYGRWIMRPAPRRRNTQSEGFPPGRGAVAGDRP